jgi:hypothetical protein
VQKLATAQPPEYCCRRNFTNEAFIGSDCGNAPRLNAGTSNKSKRAAFSSDIE